MWRDRDGDLATQCVVYRWGSAGVNCSELVGHADLGGAGFAVAVLEGGIAEVAHLERAFTILSALLIGDVLRELRCNLASIWVLSLERLRVSLKQGVEFRRISGGSAANVGTDAVATTAGEFQVATFVTFWREYRAILGCP